MGAIIEIALFFFGFTMIKEYFNPIDKMNPIIAYWLGFTILTGFWELIYITNRKKVNNMSQELIDNKEYAWTNKYSISMILPWNLSKIFYAEYGAWADREYMTSKDNWSSVIEGSHCFLCGLLSLNSFYSIVINKMPNFYMAFGAAMGSQLMNSILYMAEYFIQVKTPSNINYNTDNFPCGNALLKRPFMYVNIFWTLMPAYAICKYIEF